MSGTMREPWVVSKQQVVQGSNEVVKIIGCKKDSSELTVKCLRGKDSSKQLQSEKDFHSQNQVNTIVNN